MLFVMTTYSVSRSMWLLKTMTCEVQFYVQLSFGGYFGIALKDHCGGGLASYFSHSTGSISTLAFHSIIPLIFVNTTSTSARFHEDLHGNCSTIPTTSCCLFFPRNLTTCTACNLEGYMLKRKHLFGCTCRVSARSEDFVNC